jgi:hypothetical protein
MRRFYLLCLLAGACGPALPDVDAELAARRAALGLAQDPLPFADAMAWMEAQAVEGLLTRVGSRHVPRDDVLDAALGIENALARAELASAGHYRAPDREGFDRLMRRTREQANALARAMVEGADGKAEAAALLTGCVECHRTHRRGP